MGPHALAWGASNTFSSAERSEDTSREKVAREEGIEPPTRRLTAACSTAELLPTKDKAEQSNYGSTPKPVKDQGPIGWRFAS